ncbi:SusC/RagA family TonB-linked outer membrane protein [Bacteroidota bacterium]
MKKDVESKAQSNHPRLDNLALKNLLRIFSFTVLCFFLSMTQVMAVDLNSQESQLSLNKNNESLENVSGNFAQPRTVTGTVTDANGEPLVGVTVIVKGTTMGAITDINGNYTLPDVPEDATLVISFIGMISQEFVVGNQQNIDAVLVEDLIGIEELVVVGYTSRKKGEITGSISTIKSADLEKTSNKDLAKSLAGKVTGLIVNDRGGYPGQGDMTLLIRGKSTLGNNSPLILIDGITAGDFSNLAPQDIESISVLKDGAAAIYGARAANGVILITTKRGKTGKPQINFSSSYTISSFSVSPKLMSSSQYAIYSNEFAARNGTPLPFTQDDIDKYAAGGDPINYPSTDWMDLTMAKTSPEFRTSLAVSGGNDKVNYFVSGDLVDQVGIYKSGDLKFRQYQVRSNTDIKVHESFKVSVDLSGRFGQPKEPGVDDGYIYKHIYTNEPTEVGIYPNGLVAWGGENGANPYIMSSKESGFVERTNNDLRGKLSFDWNLDKLTQGLSIKGFMGIRKMSNDVKSWYTPWTVYNYQQGTDVYVPELGYSQRGSKNILREDFWKYDELMLNATVYYNRTFDDHTIRGFAGYEQMSSQQRDFWAERKDFPSKNHPELFAGSDEGQQSYGSSAEWGRLNYFGALSYDYQKKYFIDLTLRHDGSSNFGKGKQFGTFPGAAVSWSIANESFMNGLGWLDDLRLRASWALMGNDRIPPFQYLTRYDYGGPSNAAQPNYYILGTAGVRYNGYTSANVPNPNITWETASMRNFGLNFGLLERKLSGDINYFYAKREDILITRNASIPDAAGLTLPQENLGKVDNFGWEFELAWNDLIGDLSYNIGANFTQAKNKVVYLDEAADVPEWRKVEGHPMDSYLMYPTNGIFRDQAQVDATVAKKPGTVEGEPFYLDTDGNDVINSNDRVRSYTSNVPEIQYGIYGGIGYKGFNFSFLLQGQAKAEMLVFFDQGGAKPEYVFTERWTPDNRDSRYPRAFAQGDPYSGSQVGSGGFEVADIYLHDASFLKLREVELAYTFTQEKIRIGNLTVFARGFNLLTMFSEVYKLGLDPEAVGYDNFRQGTYPSLKSYTFGLNLNF